MSEEHDHLGFLLRRSDLRDDCLIPKAYDPEIDARLEQLRGTHLLVNIGDLIDAQDLVVDAGHEIGKMSYGTGSIPFVRTSDLSNWEIKSDPKQGVSRELYETYSRKQDVREGDLLFVRDGTYLVGSVAMVTVSDGPMLYQSHLLRFRTSDRSPIPAALLLIALSAPIVRRQIRAMQFTADIIDTVGNRYRDIQIPVPQDDQARNALATEAAALVEERGRLREILRNLPSDLEIDAGTDAENPVVEDEPSRQGFYMRRDLLVNQILLPGYYAPTIDNELGRLRPHTDLPTIGDLETDGLIRLQTGVEPGKMAYGLGTVPFVRTTDFANWELRADAKQHVSLQVYNRYKSRLDVKPDDILFVRDGTYLVGTSCILTDSDADILYASGIFKIRVLRPDQLDPYLLLAALNTSIVKRQVRAKQFTRDIIDTIGWRVRELALPLPKDLNLRMHVASEMRRCILRRVELRDRLRDLTFEIEGLTRDAGLWEVALVDQDLEADIGDADIDQGEAPLRSSLPAEWSHTQSGRRMPDTSSLVQASRTEA